MKIGINSKAISLVSQQIYRDTSRWKKSIRPLMRKAGNVIRRKERELLKGGAGPSIRKIARTSKKTGKTRSTSQLLSQHKVVIRGSFWEITGLEMFVGPTPGGKAYYGKFHELGVGERRTKKGASRGRLEAKPWMKPAMESTIKEVEEILADSFKSFRIVGR